MIPFKTAKLITILVVIVVGMVAGIIFGAAHERRRGLGFFAGWVVPGLGHVVIGKWRKGAFLFGLLAITYLFGLWLSGWRTVSFDDNPFYHVGMYGSGLTTALGFLLGDPKAFPRDDIPKSWFDPGLLYVCVVGLLNIVIMISLIDFKAKSPAKEEAAVAAGPSAKAEAQAPATGEGAEA